MTIEFWEARDTRNTTDEIAGRNAIAELNYFLRGTDDEVFARTVAKGNVAQFYSNLKLRSVSLKHAAPKLWEVVARYAFPDDDRSEEPPDTGDSSYSFDIGGGTQTRLHTIATKQKKAADGDTAVDNNGLIGVTKDSVEGVEVGFPEMTFTEQHFLPAAVVTLAYINKLMKVAWKTNKQPFRQFAAGELLFVGASGQRRGRGDWQITYNFKASENATDISVGSITGISKRGHEYLWVRYVSEKDGEASAMTKKPQTVYVEQVYEEADFSELGI